MENKGFTLIELLVVVAIIAVLTAIVLVSIDTAKKKGADASVKSNLDTIRQTAELFYSDNNSYLPAGGVTYTTATCPSYNVAGTNMLSTNKSIAAAIAEAVNRAGNGSSCYNSSNTWAVAVGLALDTSTSWCVDTSGAARAVPSSGAINITTGLCN